MGLQVRDPSEVLAELEKTPGEMNEEQVRLAARFILHLAIAYYETEEGKKSGKESAEIRKEGRNTRKIRQKCNRLAIFEARRIRKSPGQFASGHYSSSS